MTLVASVISVVVSFGVMHIETVKAYAATDIEERMPAVQQRLYNAKLWILEHVDFLEGKE